MSDPTTIEALVAFFAPLAVSLVKQAGWSSSANSLVALAAYVVFGIGAVLAQGLPLTLDGIVPSIAVFVGGGTVAYNLVWKNTGLQTAITESTSIVKAPSA